jgi:hypothetical protein
MKVLNEQGLQYLWSKILLEDYPNNETLVAVLNAIDETKADKNQLNDYLLKSEYTPGGGGSSNTEEWTFTLVDGTVITKQMVVD